MKRLLLLTTITGALALSACGGTGAVHVAQEAKDPAVQKRVQEAQQIVQTCVSKGNLISHAGRQKVLACIAPPGKKAAFEACAQKAIADNGVLTHKKREASMLAVADCVVSVR